MKLNPSGRIGVSISILLGAALAYYSVAGAKQIEPRDPFARIVPAITLKEQTIFEPVAKLYEATGIPVSVERVLSDTDASKTDLVFTTILAGGTPAHVLDEICALDNRYAWSRDSNVVNIFPRARSRDTHYLFNRRIPVFRLDLVQSTGVAAVYAADQVTGPRPQLMVLGAGGIDFDKPWTVAIPNLTLRQAIDRIAAHACPGCGWQLTGTKALPIVMFYRRLESSSAP